MKKTLLAIALVFWSFSSAGADATYTVDRFFYDMISTAATKCQDRGALERKFAEQGKMAEARSIKLAETMICDCMPTQVKALRASLPKSTLQQKITGIEFQNQYGPQIVNKCAAEQIKLTYGEGCAEAFNVSIKDSAAYCGCMNESLSRLPDSQLARIGSESADYIPRAAEAKKRGAPAPEQSPALQQFFAIDAACR